MVTLCCDRAEHSVPQTPHPALGAIADFVRPVLAVSLPAERILLASPSARELLAPDQSDVIGRCLTEYTSDGHPESATLLLNGHLNGFQSRRRLQRNPSTDVDLWFRAAFEADSCPQVLVLMSAAAEEPDWASTSDAGSTPAVIGSVDRHFAVDRISDDVEQFLGYPPEDLLGHSLLGLISPDDLPDLLFSVAQATAAQSGVCLAVKLLRPDHVRVRCQVALLPISPAPSFAFAIQPAPEFVGDRRTPNDLRSLLRRFVQGISAAAAARELTSYRSELRPTLPQLTSRELQIVSRLLAGDRVPAISRQLYLAQSTVRNHLSAVFAKLGVKSQQELIVLLRRAQHRPDR